MTELTGWSKWISFTIVRNSVAEYDAIIERMIAKHGRDALLYISENKFMTLARQAEEQLVAEGKFPSVTPPGPVEKEITIKLSPELMAALPDLARLWKNRDEDDYFKGIKIPKSEGGLERMATERFEACKDPKVSREIGIVMCAPNLTDEAATAVLAKVVRAAFAKK